MYVSLFGEEVVANLEGIARARLEKRPSQYQSDAAVHHAYVRATTGGGETGDRDDGRKAARRWKVRKRSPLIFH